MDARMNDKMSKKNSRPLSLRVPEPSGRPGDAPDLEPAQVLAARVDHQFDHVSAPTTTRAA